jgi:prepilin-type N-terminal cleavage/methylation domain-containing protein
MIRASKYRRRPDSVLTRAGFTLVELLVVIIVLAILVGLLLPVISAAFRTAKNAAAQAEINQLAQALASFRAAYGDYPPSRVLLCENGAYPVTNGQFVNGDQHDITIGALAQRSLIALRKFFPKVVFSTSGAAPPQVFYNPPPGNGFWYDFNGNGVMDSPYILQGDECLVFFLGGIPFQDSLTGSFGMTGFGKDPVNPFTNNLASDPRYNGQSNPMYSANRQQPSFEFNPGRLFLNPANPAPLNSAVGLVFPQIPGYYDNLGGNPPPSAGSAPQTMNFYVYFSGYGNGVYDANDVNYLFMVSGNVVGFESDGNLANPIGLTFQHAGVQYPSAAPNPYTSTLTANNPSGALSTGSVGYQKAQTFQIFSPGVDGLYGVGGQFVAPASASTTAANPLPFDKSNTFAGLTPPTPTQDGTIRLRERDNLTNFQSGTLE